MRLWGDEGVGDALIIVMASKRGVPAGMVQRVAVAYLSIRCVVRQLVLTQGLAVHLAKDVGML